MSTIAFRPRGGQDGIKVSMSELERFADFIGIPGVSTLDNHIPLPGVSKRDQKEKIKECGEHKTMPDMLYWEVSRTGNHGWCCKKCGTTLQWG